MSTNLTFQDIDRRYAELEGQYRSGMLSLEQFNAEVVTLMTRDEHGRWWTKRRGDGAWRVFDGSNWVPGDPYATAATPQPAQAPADVPAPAAAQPVEHVAAQATPQSAAQAAPEHGAQPVEQPAHAGLGAKAVLYVVLAIIPIIGLALWASFRKSEEPAKRKIAPLLAIIAICSFALGVALSAL